LTPSRAAIVASLDSADTDPESFVRQLGIERVQALVQDEPWILRGELLCRLKLMHWVPRSFQWMSESYADSRMRMNAALRTDP